MNEHKLRFAQVYFADRSMMIQEYVAGKGSTLNPDILLKLSEKVSRVIKQDSTPFHLKWYALDLQGKDNVLSSDDGHHIIVDPFYNWASPFLEQSAW